jgi:hypothetical protein
MIVIIKSTNIDNIDQFEQNGYTIQRVLDTGIFFFISDLGQLIAEVEEFDPGTYFVCKMDFPFDAPKYPESPAAKEFLDDVFRSIHNQCDISFCIRKLFSIVIP